MFNIPTVTRNLLITNVLVFLLATMLQRAGIVDLNEWLGLHFILAKNFMPHQLVTYLFMHGGGAHLFLNMFSLWMFGAIIEQAWGGKRFFIYYILCGIGAGMFQEVAQLGSYLIEGLYQVDLIRFADGMVMPVDKYLSLWTTVGASGSVYGILLAFGMMFPENRIFIFPIPVPIKAKWFVWMYAAIELVAALSNSNDNVAHIAHLGGMLVGYLLIRYWRRQEYTSYTVIRKKKPHFWQKMPKHDGYNRNEKKQESEMDIILDKIRKNGYDSLTNEEKKRLFDISNRR